ncbi:AbrB family transcriptional regulator [Betaproteobacteria bacterium]|nr:AbrB family transcriptional regulator [Betaproteobacteria bacterium]
MRIAKWGNSLAVRLPASLVKTLRLSDGEEVEIDVRRKVSRKEDFGAAVRELRETLPLLPADFKFDREEANARR